MKANFLPTFLAAAALAATLPADSESAAFKGLCEYVSGADSTPLRQYDELVARASHDAKLRKTVEADFIRVLTGTSTFEAKRFACQRLAVVGTESSVPALAGLLAQDETLGIACAALVQIPAPKAGAELRKALGTAKGRSLEQVIYGLGIRADSKAVSQLIALTANPDPGVAGAACVAIGRIGNSAAQKALASLRKQCPPPLVRNVAEGSFFLAEGLAAKGKTNEATKVYEETLAGSWPLDVQRGSLAALIRLEGAGAEERIVQVLASTNTALKAVAIAAVPSLPGPDASRVMADELSKLLSFERVLLIQALALRGDAPARAAIEMQLGVADLAVRLAAIAELGKIGGPEMVTTLSRTLIGKPAPEELKAVEAALAGLKGGEATDRALVAQLLNRMAANKTPILAALVRRANPDSIKIFVTESASSDPTMARLAFQGLARVATADDVPTLLTALAQVKAEAVREDAAASVAQALSRVGTPERNADAIRAALKAAPGAKAMETFLPLFAVCPDARGLEMVTEAAGSADPAIRDVGVRTLADWPAVAAWDPLLAVYGRSNSETERVLALRGLSRLLGDQNSHPDERLIARYREMLTSAKSDNDRKLILGPLAGCNDPAALKLAVEQLSNAGVRAEAALAVRKIAEAIKAQHPQAAADALKALQ